MIIAIITSPALVAGLFYVRFWPKADIQLILVKGSANDPKATFVI